MTHKDRQALIEACLDDNMKLGEMIREFRNQTGLGLRAAINFVEEHLQVAARSGYPNATAMHAEIRNIGK